MPLSDTHITLYGMWHLIGETVQVSICGLDCGDYTVSDLGAVTVPLESDDQGLLTAAYIYALDGYTGEHKATITLYVDNVQQTVTVPVFIGMQYTSQGQTLRPATREDVRFAPGNALGVTRRSHEFGVLFHNVVEVSFGTDFDDLDLVEIKQDDGETAQAQDVLYSGVYRAVLTDPYSYDSMLAWEIDRPWPATICAVSAFLIAEHD